MDTTTTDNFTKELFDVLRLEWNQYAEARNFLSGIIVQKETVETILEDIVFSLTQFLNYLRIVKNIPLTDRSNFPFILCNNNYYCIQIGTDQSSQIIFVIVVTEEGYSFQKSLNSESSQHRHCQSLEELKLNLLLWFDEFYSNLENKE